ncbi:zinc finger CCCH domain-containing protein 19-like [Nymphaea colorata]|nr:zinc finger CCCH domain-containing protein 19-like [Nymphaea colorata]
MEGEAYPIMDGGSRDSNPQTTSEDEANKRNTDCVYFLASPLTCIKGADCEYRHSESARINPRDCWFWLNGNCLNPKCSFRHPPLDGFRGVSTNASAGPSQPSLQPAMPAQAPHYTSAPYHPTSYTSNKQKVPCYYFQKGLCLKGDKCPFMHGSQPAGDSTLPQTSKTAPVSDPQFAKKTVNGTENPTSLQRNPPQAFALRAVEVAPIITADGKRGALPSVGNVVQKNKTPANVDDKPIRSTQAATMVPSGSTSVKPRLRQSQSQDERFQNGKDVDECLGESSPGFDVLVDDDLEEEYFDSDMERAPGHGGRHLNSQREFDRMGSGTDTLGEFDEEHGELGPYDVYGRKQDQFGWEQSQAPMERVLERPSMSERRLSSREESPVQREGRDLRHRLSKRRRVNEPRAITSSNHHGDLYRKDDQFVEDRYRRHSRQENLQHSSTESSLGKRLHGRIKFPGRPSPESSSEPHSDMELEQRKMRGRSSPSRAGLHLGRIREKVRGRTNEDIATEGSSFRGQAIRSEERKADSLDFAGPKSLAELKSAKVYETQEERNVVASASRQALKSQVVHGEGEKGVELRKCIIQDSNASLSFEGPKPLSEILKKKRETSSGHSSDLKKEENQMEKTHGNSDIADLQTPVAEPAEPKKEATAGSSHSPISAGTDQDKLELTDEVHPFRNDESPTEADYNAQEEDALMLDSEDQVVGNPERDRESEDAGIEENPDGEDEYEDDEDGDDFARKLGVMFS